jgi:5-methylcytosine-specific restriction endonuclease McrA
MASTLGHTLALNADGTALKVVTAERAICEVMANKAFQVEKSGSIARSQHVTVDIPLVIQYLKFQRPSKKSRSLALTPRNVCARDRWECAYQRPDVCLGKATTIDHIQPKSKGGPNTWENVVAACKRCNQLKGSKTLDELGWEIHTKPWRPIGTAARVLAKSHDSRWDSYIRRG